MPGVCLYPGRVTGLICRRLRGWADPASLFAQREAREDVAFWLDAGADADSAETPGWSYLGSGTGVPDVVQTPALAAIAVGRAHDLWPAGPFRGGWIGWTDYESGAARAGAPVAGADDDVRVSAWIRADRFLAFDHANREVWAAAIPSDVDDVAADAQERVDAAADGDPGCRPDEPGAENGAEQSSAMTRATARHTPERYARLVEDCRELIRQGEAYQLCLTTRFEVPHVGVGAAAKIYERLRRSSPAHHAAYLRVGDTAVLSATPERFLSVRGERVWTSPIKGTRPRGGDADADAALAADLASSPKERSENVMIVDLMRNDLARVCEPGTVVVESLLDVESYPQVHQLVSTVSGRLRTGVTVEDLLARTFPAGSMTGAPKLSAMTHLHELEHGARGIFSGALGWIGDDGDVELAMVIRTIVLTGGRAIVGAGGGITWRSVAAEEVREVALKAHAPLAAVGARVPWSV